MSQQDISTRSDNERLIDQFRALAGSGEYLPLDRLFPPDLGDLFPPGYDQHEERMAQGVEGVRQFLDALGVAFPDIRGRVDDVIAEGDKLVVRMTWEGTHRGEFMGIPPTGKRVSYGRIEIWRVENGKLAEHWGEFDFYGLLRQIDAIPAS